MPEFWDKVCMTLVFLVFLSIFLSRGGGAAPSGGLRPEERTSKRRVLAHHRIHLPPWHWANALYTRPLSSVGQSSALVMRGSGVRLLQGAPRTVFA